MYLEWYDKYRETAVYDVKQVRETMPAANVVRFVAILWRDSNGAGDGMECSSTTSAPVTCGTIACTDTGRRGADHQRWPLWVILTARAKYAAGYTWPDDPDVFHNAQLRQRFYSMWRFVAREFSGTDRIAGFEIMSEPRTRSVSQTAVMELMAGGCDAVHDADPRALCIVGPAPYYKVWELPKTRLPDRHRNIMYTFNFYVPGRFVASNSAESLRKGEEPPSFPGAYACKDVYDWQWWREHCKTEPVQFDAAFMHDVIRAYPGALRKRLRAPIFCNQWGVKDEVARSHGRLDYATSLLSIFAAENVSSTYWIWRSYAKGGRDVARDEWGFELLHNPGHGPDGRLLPERVEPAMTALLQAGFATTNPNPVPSCVDDWNNSLPDFPVPLHGGRVSTSARPTTLAGQPPDSCRVLALLTDARVAAPSVVLQLAVRGAECLDFYTERLDGVSHRCEPSTQGDHSCVAGPEISCTPVPHHPPPPRTPLTRQRCLHRCDPSGEAEHVASITAAPTRPRPRRSHCSCGRTPTCCSSPWASFCCSAYSVVVCCVRHKDKEEAA